MYKSLIAVIGIILFAGLYIYNANYLGSKPTQSPVHTDSIKTPEHIVNVILTANGFEPQMIKIKAGTEIIWTNKSGRSATVNSDPHPIHNAYPPLNLGQFNDGQSVILVFDKTGTYGYHNHLIPDQTGKVIVE